MSIHKNKTTNKINHSIASFPLVECYNVTRSDSRIPSHYCILAVVPFKELGILITDAIPMQI